MRYTTLTAAILAAALASAGAGRAATMTQAQAFSATFSSLQHPSGFQVSAPQPELAGMIGSKTFTLAFGGFDTALGTLQGVSLQLDSTFTRQGAQGLFIAGQLTARLMAYGQAFMGQQFTVRRGGQQIFQSSDDRVGAICEGVGFCLAELENSGTFDGAAAFGPAAYQGNPVTFALNIYAVNGLLFDPHPADYPPNSEQGPFGWQSETNWDGVLRLTYVYDPAVTTPPPAEVPEPAGLSLLAFGVAAALTTRRRIAVSSPLAS